jgi:hypothetical protein
VWKTKLPLLNVTDEKVMRETVKKITNAKTPMNIQVQNTQLVNHVHHMFVQSKICKFGEDAPAAAANTPTLFTVEFPPAADWATDLSSSEIKLKKGRAAPAGNLYGTARVHLGDCFRVGAIPGSGPWAEHTDLFLVDPPFGTNAALSNAGGLDFPWCDDEWEQCMSMARVSGAPVCAFFCTIEVLCQRAIPAAKKILFLGEEPVYEVLGYSYQVLRKGPGPRLEHNVEYCVHFYPHGARWQNSGGGSRTHFFGSKESRPNLVYLRKEYDRVKGKIGKPLNPHSKPWAWLCYEFQHFCPPNGRIVSLCSGLGE